MTSPYLRKELKPESFYRNQTSQNETGSDPEMDRSLLATTENHTENQDELNLFLRENASELQPDERESMWLVVLAIITAATVPLYLAAEFFLSR